MNLDERIKDEALKFVRRKKHISWPEVEKLIQAAYCDGVDYEREKHASYEPMKKNIGRNN